MGFELARYGGYDYLILVRGTQFYCIDANERVVRSGTDPTPIIQYAIDQLESTGGVIKIGAGTFEITDTIDINAGNLTLEGSGTGYTIIQAKNSLNKDLITLTATGAAYFNVFKFLKIDGNKANNTSGDGINVGANHHDLFLFDIFITSCKDDNVYLADNWGLKVDKCVFEYAGAWGFNMASSNFGWSITNCKIISNFQQVLINGQGGVISGCFIGDSNEDGVLVTGHYNAVIGNYFYTANKDTAAWKSSIKLSNTQGISVIANIFEDSAGHPSFCVYMAGADNSRVAYNYVVPASYSTAAMYVDGGGTGNIIRDNAGWITENFGTAVMTSGTAAVTVTHGLNATPDDFSIIGSHAEVQSLYLTTIGATTFIINTADGNTTANRDIYWGARVR